MTNPSSSPSSARHRAREVALQTLFAMDLQQLQQERSERTPAPAPKAPSRERVQRRPLRRRSAGVPDAEKSPCADHSEVPPIPPASTPALDVVDVFEGIAKNFEMPSAAHAFARDLVERVVECCAGLDEIVAGHAKNWRLSRMAVVDRNILRLATFELVHTATPAAVVLNEAVELAHRFGSDESPGFVNGVLDAVAREVRAGESP